MVNQRYPRLPVKGPTIIPNGCQVKWLWIIDGQPCSYVYHGSISTGPVNPAMPELIMQSLLSSAAFTAWRTKISTTVFFVGVMTKDLRTAYQPTLQNTTLTNLAGTSTGDHGAANAALVVTKHTANSGKGFFGRAYLLGITQDNYADSRHFDTTIGVPAQNFCNAMTTAMGTAGVTWGVGQRQLQANLTPGAPPIQATARPASIIPGVSQSVINYRIDSQRRRLGKR
jgi:hypothetical protein